MSNRRRCEEVHSQLLKMTFKTFDPWAIIASMVRGCVAKIYSRQQARLGAVGGGGWGKWVGCVFWKRIWVLWKGKSAVEGVFLVWNTQDSSKTVEVSTSMVLLSLCFEELGRLELKQAVGCLFFFRSKGSPENARRAIGKNMLGLGILDLLLLVVCH